MSNENFITTKTIGIIGCGHLGSALALSLLENGLPKNQLLLSHKENTHTQQQLKQIGLGKQVVSNEEIYKKANLVFLAVRPQGIEQLTDAHFKKDAIIISCMAGIPLNTLTKLFKTPAFRIMTSGPETIRNQKGIVALYPYQEDIAALLTHMRFRVYTVPTEDAMHLFTVGVCLPAALILAKERGLDIDTAIDTIEHNFPSFRTIQQWAADVLPVFTSQEDQEQYVTAMSTPGGITEAIVTSLRSGENLLTALQKGATRSREISNRFLQPD